MERIGNPTVRRSRQGLARSALAPCVSAEVRYIGNIQSRKQVGY